MTIAAHAKPRVLFYLPVVTPGWFTDIVVPLIRAASRGGEVHVLVPPLWSYTGIRAEELGLCLDLDDVSWHILDGDDHPDLRFSAAGQDDLLALVHEIDPDLCLCRSADIETPALFPGVVRYIMEGAAPPFGIGQYEVQFTQGLFDHAVMPELTPEQEQWLDASFAGPWADQVARYPQMERAEFLARAGLPTDKLLIGMPLEYEHEENFFDLHNIYAMNVELLDALADTLGDDIVLAVTQHPINDRWALPSELKEALNRHRDKIRLVPRIGEEGNSTKLLTRHCDGLIVGNSKSFTGCAMVGKPMLRITKFATGGWLQAYATLPPFIDALRSGTARAASETDARRWFAFHFANTVLIPKSPKLDLAEMLDHAINPVNPARWEKGLARYLGDKAHLLPPLSMFQSRESLCHV